LIASVLGWVGFFFFIIILIVGLLSLVFGIPGTWIILADAAFYGWATHFSTVTGKILLVLLIFAVCGELLEFSLSFFGLKRMKPSKGVMAISLLCGFVTAILMAPLFFGLGAILGALVGAFGGAFLVEYLTVKRLDHAARIGWGALIGRLVGFISKFAVASAMIAVIIINL
jgi:uncharacterized protein YqgC (DUF456 family)